MTKQSIARNSTYLLAASIIQKILNLGYFVLIARSFGPADQGKYSTALAFAALFSVAIDFGAAAVLTREVARDNSRASHYLSHILLFRICVGIITYGVIIIVSQILSYSQEIQFLIALASISMVLDMISTAIWAVFRGFQNFKYEGFAMIGTNLVAVVGGTLCILFHAPLYSLVAILIAASLANVCYGFFLLCTKYHIQLDFRIQLPLLKKIIYLALPFAGAAVFSRIYTNSDLVLLSKLAGELHVGWYSAANKAILALQFMPAAITGALYPALSKYYDQEPHRVGELFARAVILLLLFVLPASVGITLLSQPIVDFFYGSQYGPTIGVFQVLSVALVFAFLIFPLGVVIAATNRQILNTVVLGLAACINVAGNLIFIPQFGLIGAAWISVITYGGIFVVEMIATWNYWKSQKWFLANKTLKIILSSGVMGITLLLVKSIFTLPILIGIGAISYAVALVIFRAVTYAELHVLFRSSLGKSFSYEKDITRHS